VSAEEVKPYSDIQVGRQKSAEVIVFGIRAGKKMPENSRTKKD
jgi:hypothetical protein